MHVLDGCLVGVRGYSVTGDTTAAAMMTSKSATDLGQTDCKQRGFSTTLFFTQISTGCNSKAHTRSYIQVSYGRKIPLVKPIWLEQWFSNFGVRNVSVV